MPIKRCGGGCGGFERGEGGHNGTENKKAHLSVSIFDTARHQESKGCISI